MRACLVQNSLQLLYWLNWYNQIIHVKFSSINVIIQSPVIGRTIDKTIVAVLKQQNENVYCYPSVFFRLLKTGFINVVGCSNEVRAQIALNTLSSTFEVKLLKTFKMSPMLPKIIEDSRDKKYQIISFKSLSRFHDKYHQLKFNF